MSKKILNSIIKKDIVLCKELVSSKLLSLIYEEIKLQKNNVGISFIDYPKTFNDTEIEKFIDFLKLIVQDNESSTIILSSGELMVVDPIVAESLLTLLNSLDNDHKTKIITNLSKNSEFFLKTIKFTLDSIKPE